MTFVITQPCIDTMDQSCVEVCPVDCIHFDEDSDRMLYISPVECIDCGACQPACPVSAIFPEDEVPADQAFFTEINSLWFEDAAAARARVPGEGGAAAPAAVAEAAPEAAADAAPEPEEAPAAAESAPAAEPAAEEEPAPAAAAQAAPAAAVAAIVAPPPVRPHARKQDYQRAFAGFHFPISRDAVIRGARDKGGVDREVAAIIGRLHSSRFRTLEELHQGVREVYLSLGVDGEQLPI